MTITTSWPIAVSIAVFVIGSGIFLIFYLKTNYPGTLQKIRPFTDLMVAVSMAYFGMKAEAHWLSIALLMVSSLFLVSSVDVVSKEVKGYRFSLRFLIGWTVVFCVELGCRSILS